MPATEKHLACLMISAETSQALRSKPTCHAQTARRIQIRRFCNTLHDPPAPRIDSGENVSPPSAKAERRHGHDFKLRMAQKMIRTSAHSMTFKRRESNNPTSFHISHSLSVLPRCPFMFPPKPIWNYSDCFYHCTFTTFLEIS